jgi:hypothetical protein
MTELSGSTLFMHRGGHPLPACLASRFPHQIAASARVQAIAVSANSSEARVLRSKLWQDTSGTQNSSLQQADQAYARVVDITRGCLDDLCYRNTM